MYIYTHTAHEDERDLARLELRSLFGYFDGGGIIVDKSDVGISVDRSPFLKKRIEVTASAQSMEGDEGLLQQLKLFKLKADETFKVVFCAGDEPYTYAEKRELERLAGGAIRGKAEMRTPDAVFGIVRLNGQWHCGPAQESSALWLKHQDKPQNYSTALNTRTARAVVNIAAGRDTNQLRMVDPCCGIGTVLIEALSMGIEIDGFDNNPLAVKGARMNLSHFGYSDCVGLADMRSLEGRYDAAVIDMPYNLCSVLPEEESLAMLNSVRRLARRAAVVTTIPIEGQLVQVGWSIVEQALVRKGAFTRFITVVE